MTTQAPSIKNLQQSFNATFAMLSWNFVGEGFYFIIERNAPDINPAWIVVSPYQHTQNTFFDQDLLPNTNYQYRITTQGFYFTPSSPVYSVLQKTFETNAYRIATKPSVGLYDNFTDKMFGLDDDSIVTGDFALTLMKSDYSFNPAHLTIDDPLVDNYKSISDSTIEIYGRPPSTCGGYGVSIPAIYNDVCILFQRNQKLINLTYDKGKNWHTIRALPDRAGDPYHQSIYSHNAYGLFVLGMNTIMVIRDFYNVYWSNDGFHFANDDINFVNSPDFANTDLQFVHFVDIPSYVQPGSPRCTAISSDANYIYVTYGNKVFRCNILTKVWDPIPAYLLTNAQVKDFVSFHGNCYASTTGLGGCFTTDGVNAGIYEVGPQWPTTDDPGTFVPRVYGTNNEQWIRLDPVISALSRDDNRLLLGVNPYPYNDVSGINSSEYVPMIDHSTTERPYREIVTLNYVSTDINGRNIFVTNETNREAWQYEEQYLYSGVDTYIDPDFHAPRIRITDTDVISVITPLVEFEHNVEITKTFANGVLTITINPSVNNFFGFNGYALGAVLYNKDTRELICHNSLDSRARNEANFTWLSGNVVARGTLQQQVPLTSDLIDPTLIAPLEPFAEKFLPDHYSYREPKFVEFVRGYLKYISDGSLSNYGQLYNLLRSHDANEPSIFTDMFETDMMRRNISVTPDMRKQLNKFLFNTVTDFYSTKGTVDSYKFLFKLLYGEDVNVKVENSYAFTYEFDVIYKLIDGVPTTSLDETEQQSIGPYITGNKMYQSESSTSLISDIPTYGEIVEAIYKYTNIDGYPVYKLRVINSFGLFLTEYGYEVETVDHLSHLQVLTDPIIVPHEFVVDNSDRQFNFILRLESSLPASRYYNDVITFVHPVGFDFIGAYLIVSFLNSPITDYHIETIVQWSDSVRWDNGVPANYPVYIPDLDINEEYQFDAYGRLKVKLNPLTGPITPPIDYATDNPDPGTLPYGLTRDERRKNASPLFDGSSGRFFDRINNPDTANAFIGADIVSLNRCWVNRQRLKDNIQDPHYAFATQRREPVYIPPSGA